MRLLFFFIAAIAVIHAEVIPLSPSSEFEDVTNQGLQTEAGILRDKTGEICCKDLGCFSSAAPFFDIKNRPISVVPNCQLIGHLDLHLNTRENPRETQILNPYEPNTIAQSKLKLNKPVRILVHGFIDNYKGPNWVDMLKGLLDYEDSNIIRMDWSYGNAPPYFQATANTRLVGAYIAKFVLVLHEKFGVSLDQIHVIGHSLGAHIGGYVGKFVADNTNGTQIGRITGLDPAGPYFSYMSEDVRLDPSDAKVVDTIITDGEDLFNGDFVMSYGSPQSMGHFNFRPNGGLIQPGCNRNILERVGDCTSESQQCYIRRTLKMLGGNPLRLVVGTAAGIFSCNHPRAVFLFTESLNKTLPAMKAFQCDSYNKFLEGQCFDCQGNSCSKVGIAADLSLAEKDKVKDLYFTTTQTTPFATSLYKATFTLKTASGMEQKDYATQMGQIFMVLKGKKDQTGRKELTKTVIDLVPGKTYSAFFDAKEDLGDVLSMTFMWKSKTGLKLRGPRYIYVNSEVELKDQNGKTTIFRLARNKIEDNTEIEAIFSRSF